MWWPRKPQPPITRTLPSSFLVALGVMMGEKRVFEGKGVDGV